MLKDDIRPEPGQGYQHYVRWRLFQGNYDSVLRTVRLRFSAVVPGKKIGLQLMFRMVISKKLRPRIPAFLDIIAKIGENPGLSGALPPDKPCREVRDIPFRQNDFKLSTP